MACAAVTPTVAPTALPPTFAPTTMVPTTLTPSGALGTGAVLHTCFLHSSNHQVAVHSARRRRESMACAAVTPTVAPTALPTMVPTTLTPSGALGTAAQASLEAL